MQCAQFSRRADPAESRSKADESSEAFEAFHTFSDEQVEWFKAGGARLGQSVPGRRVNSAFGSPL